MYYKLSFTLINASTLECIVTQSTYTYLKKIFWKKSDIGLLKGNHKNPFKWFFGFIWKFITKYIFGFNLRFLCNFFILQDSTNHQISNANNLNYLFDYKDVENLKYLENKNSKKEIWVNINNVLVFSYEPIEE